MLTYNDLQNAGNHMDFVAEAISQHKTTSLYNMSVIADEYDRQQNRTIMAYQKLLYTISGKAVPDNYSANYKLCSNFLNRFITQENQYLLGNGVTWQEESTADKLGDDFDVKLQEAGHEALLSGVSFGFWNLDHLEVFNLREFVPLYDEENGALMAGIRFWQIDSTKPMRATLYETDGYTDYMWKDGKGSVIHDKQNYVLNTITTKADGTYIYDGENYNGFPIVPLWGNKHRQSELVGLRQNIDAYDLIKSGFANDVDDASQIYWTIQNAGGMDEVDLAHFLDQMHRVKAAVVDDDDAKAEAHTIDVPTASREAILDRLRADMYEDFMALDTKNIADGATTATQIKAAYEPLNNKTDAYEYLVIDFLKDILALAGIEDTPSFTRSVIVNTQEEIQTVLQAAEYIDEEYTTRKILTLLGDGDMADEILDRVAADELEMGGLLSDEEDFEEDEDIEEEDTAESDAIQNILDKLNKLMEEL